MRYRQNLQPATRNEHIMTLVEGFGNDFDNPMEELKKVRRVGSVKEYQFIFENGGSEESYQVYLTNSWFYKECIVIHRRRSNSNQLGINSLLIILFSMLSRIPVKSVGNKFPSDFVVPYLSRDEAEGVYSPTKSRTLNQNFLIQDV
ncbi:hypothetical protein CQW23_04638 [Capsicum baccatum]|uniref:Uncharacterized protein n=1 Tax=Capsicum baccatum TaxID=33114 RepID=A0A2G2XF74_CAPBA|nr:hypothetical protein CQW23_04638 [Capsicum baccatum]